MLMYSKDLHDLLTNIKKEPEKFFRKISHEDKKEFIAGITDADGYIGSKEIAIYNSNKVLLDEICRFLNNMGVKCSVSRNRGIWRVRLRSKHSISLFLKFILSLKRPAYLLRVDPRRLNPGGEGPVSQSTTAWFCRGKLGVTDLQG